jgi:hypothetical protein
VKQWDFIHSFNVEDKFPYFNSYIKDWRNRFFRKVVTTFRLYAIISSEIKTYFWHYDNINSQIQQFFYYVQIWKIKAKTPRELDLKFEYICVINYVQNIIQIYVSRRIISHAIYRCIVRGGSQEFSYSQLTLLFCLVYSLILKMEETCSSGTSANFEWTTWQNSVMKALWEPRIFFSNLTPWN